MKHKLLVTTVFFLFISNSQAQNYKNNQQISNPYWFVNLPVTEDKKIDFAIENNIEVIDFDRYTFKKNGKKKAYYFSSTLSLNDKGQVAKRESRKNGKSTGSNTYVYNADGNILEDKYYNKKGILSSTAIQHYDGVQKAYLTINRKGDTTIMVLKGLKDVNNTSNDFYYKNGKLKYSWFNEYGVDNKVEKVTMFNGKGKQKYVWDYRCKNEGIEVYKHKDTTSVCTSVTEGEDGITTYVYQSVNEKGELVKSINRLNKLDKLVHYRRLKGSEEVIEFEYDLEYADDDSTMIGRLRKSFTKGQLDWVMDEAYEIDGRFLSSTSTYFKNNLIESESTNIYEYGSKGLPLKYVSANKVTKYKGLTEYRFTLR